MLFPTLLDTVAHNHIHLHLIAATKTLAARYEKQLPGIVVTGTKWPRGIAMAYCPMNEHFTPTNKHI